MRSRFDDMRDSATRAILYGIGIVLAIVFVRLAFAYALILPRLVIARFTSDLLGTGLILVVIVLFVVLALLHKRKN